MRKICAVAAVLATAVALAQTNTASQPAENAASQSTAQTDAPAAASTANDTNGASAQNVSATADQKMDLNRNPADRTLEKQVSDQFAHKAEFQNVKVSVVAGVVTLEGSVPTKIERRQAKALARGVNGVKKVQERLTLSGAGVSGPGTVANTTTTAQNDAPAVTGNAGAAQGQSAQTSNGGGTTGVAMNSAPPSSNIGAGTSMAQPTRSPVTPPATGQAQAQSQPAFGLTTVDPASLATKINNALKNEPTLAKNNVMVNVSDQGVEVTGSVDTGKEKTTAMRIAQSYAGNFKVVDRLTLAGHPPAPTQGQQNAATSGTSNSTPNIPPPNVAGNQVLPSNTARNSRDPKTQGDKSSNPR
jgi:osmotically-inducible protein OsmY